MKELMYTEEQLEEIITSLEFELAIANDALLKLKGGKEQNGLQERA